MYTFFEVTKQKTDCIGYWYHQRKIYKDNINKILCKDKAILDDYIKQSFDNNEQSVFYIDNESKDGFIVWRNNTIDHLKKKLFILDNRFSKSFFRLLLKKYKGITCTQLSNDIQIEVYG